MAGMLNFCHIGCFHAFRDLPATIYLNAKTINNCNEK